MYIASARANSMHIRTPCCYVVSSILYVYTILRPLAYILAEGRLITLHRTSRIYLNVAAGIATTTRYADWYLWLFLVCSLFYSSESGQTILISHSIWSILFFRSLDLNPPWAFAFQPFWVTPIFAVDLAPHRSRHFSPRRLITSQRLSIGTVWFL